MKNFKISGLTMKPFLMMGLILQCIVVFPVSAAGPSVAAEEILQRATRDCGGFEKGVFASTPGAIQHHDFNGDGKPDELIDASQFACSTAASLWGGSGGTLLWAVIDGKAFEFLAHGWRVVEMGRKPVLLLAVHHSQCGDGFGACYRAHVWDGIGFRTAQH
jgi:hypothetical protein